MSGSDEGKNMNTEEANALDAVTRWRDALDALLAGRNATELEPYASLVARIAKQANELSTVTAERDQAVSRQQTASNNAQYYSEKYGKAEAELGRLRAVVETIRAAINIENTLPDASDASIARLIIGGVLSPLRWTDRHDEFSSCVAGGLKYSVRTTKLATFWQAFGALGLLAKGNCNSVEHGKKLCWEDYGRRMAELFESVD